MSTLKALDGGILVGANLVFALKALTGNKNPSSPEKTPSPPGGEGRGEGGKFCHSEGAKRPKNLVFLFPPSLKGGQGGFSGGPGILPGLHHYSPRSPAPAGERPLSVQALPGHHFLKRCWGDLSRRPRRLARALSPCHSEDATRPEHLFSDSPLYKGGLGGIFLGGTGIMPVYFILSF